MTELPDLNGPRTGADRVYCLSDLCNGMYSALFDCFFVASNDVLRFALLDEMPAFVFHGDLRAVRRLTQID